MKVARPAVAPALADYIQGVFVIENLEVKTPFTLPLFANGTPTLMFQSAKGEMGTLSGHLTLFGQTVAPREMTIRESFVLVAYFIKPYALSALFGLPADCLTDNPTALDLLPVRGGFLQERLLNARSVTEIIAHLDDFLLGLAKRCKAVLPLREVYVTERTLQRNFQKIIGVSPGQFRRIVQFDKAFKQLNRDPSQRLSDIALDNGYADQSHYTRSFREFTGITPSEYIRRTAGL